MTCPKCLLRVADEMALCPACGEDLAPARAKAGGSALPPQPAAAPDVAKPSSLPRLIFEAEESDGEPTPPASRWPVAVLSLGIVLGVGAAWAVHGVAGPRRTPVLVVAAASAPAPVPEASALTVLDTPSEAPAPAPSAAPAPARSPASVRRTTPPKRLPTRPTPHHESRHSAPDRPVLPLHAAPEPAPPPPAPLPAYLSLNATPWGNIFLDDTAAGNTPRADLALVPGRHHVRITRPGFASYDAFVDLASGEHRHLVNIVLAPVAP